MQTLCKIILSVTPKRDKQIRLCNPHYYLTKGFLIYICATIFTVCDSPSVHKIYPTPGRREREREREQAYLAADVMFSEPLVSQ